MKQVLIELDEETAARLDRVAPGKARKRSEFIRAAVRKALWEVEERATAEAYGRKPDAGEGAHFEPALWEHAPVRRRRR